MTLKLVFTASLLDTQQLRGSVEKKAASLLAVPLGNCCGREMAGELLSELVISRDTRINMQLNTKFCMEYFKRALD